MLVIHRAERSDALVAALGEHLRVVGPDPFAPVDVAVPSRGVERWLAQRLAHQLGAAAGGDGVCANVRFPAAGPVLDELAAAADPGYAEAVERWSPGRAVWPVLSVIDTCAPTEPWCAVLGTHLGLRGGRPESPGRRYAVAARLAALFDRYGRARPALVRAWAAGDDGDLPLDLAWQPELWRRVREQIGTPAPAELLDRACAAIGAGPGLSVFGATRLSPARVQVLAALGRAREVHLWWHHPSPALWEAVAAAGERPGPRRARGPVARHPLLASMARDVRELQQLLQAVPHDDVHHPVAPRPATVLGRLQDDLAHDRPPTAPHVAPDRSLQVHAAHGPARQVEVVREAVLGLLAADPTLEPRDVVVMCPDVETYAPLVAASFGMTDEPGGHPAGRLRLTLADRALRQTNPLLRLLDQLLELAGGRVTATDLLDLAGTAPVRRRFGFDEDALERLRDWAVEGGARWGLDAEHRRRYHLGAVAQGTWRGAVDRVLLGATMEADHRWFGDVPPLDDVDSGDIDLAGRFAEFVDRVGHAVDLLSTRRPVAAWMPVLAEVVDDLGEGDQPWQALQVHRELDDLATGASGSPVELGRADVAALLQDRLAGRPTRSSFRTGSLTVCTLVPMRAVPHRVVVLLGLDDGTFPRRGTPDGDDLLARDPHSGERDPRSEDRQLFLDAVCAATEHLVVTYTGADPRTGAPVPPCVPLGELLDAVDALVVGGRDAVVTHHPLQPFDTRNFQADGPFSFDPVALAGARAAAGPRVAAPPLLAAPLPPATESVVALDDLVRFLQHPAREFLRQRLDVVLAARDEDPSDSLPIDVKGLDAWKIGERVLAGCLAGADRKAVADRERRLGAVPPGPLGDAVLREVGGTVDRLVAEAGAEWQVAPAEPLDVVVPLPDGRVLAGTVSGLRERTLLTVTYSRLRPGQRLTAWVRLLALVAGTDSADWRAVVVGRRGNRAIRSTLGGVTPAEAREHLAELVALRDEGLRAPLPLALETSEQWALYSRKGQAGAAEDRAGGAWTHRDFGERLHPAHVLVWGDGAGLEVLTAAAPSDPPRVVGETTRFGELARLVWDPLVRAERTS